MLGVRDVCSELGSSDWEDGKWCHLIKEEDLGDCNVERNINHLICNMSSGYWSDIQIKASAIRYADLDPRSKIWPLDLGTIMPRLFMVVTIGGG